MLSGGSVGGVDLPHLPVPQGGFDGLRSFHDEGTALNAVPSLV